MTINKAKKTLCRLPCKNSNTSLILVVQDFPSLKDTKFLNIKLTEEGAWFKGTVARDFWPPVFFMNQPYMGP